MHNITKVLGPWHLDNAAAHPFGNIASGD